MSMTEGQTTHQTTQERRYLYPLVYQGTNLQDVFTYLSKAIEVLLVLEGVKPVARFPMAEYDVPDVAAFCSAHGLASVRSDYKILKFVPLDKGYANKGYRMPVTSPMIGDVFIYLALSPELAQEAKMADYMDDHAALGKLLGYPECCVRFFAENAGAVKDDDDYVRLALRHSSVRHAELNILPRYFDVTLLSHFPCSFDCSTSLQLATRYLETIRKHSYGLAEHVMNTLRKPAILTRQDGVHLLFQERQEGNFLRFEDVASTVTNSFHHQLAQAKIINKDYDGLVLFS